MQAVILAAGKSTRTYPLTVQKPKPLLKIANKTLLEHNLDQLEGLVDEVIVVVHFMKEQVTDRFGSSYKGMRLRFVDQKEALGTGHALMAAEPYLNDRFLVINGDDLFSRADIEQLISHSYAALAVEVKDLSGYGAHIVEGERLVGLIEKSHNMKKGRCNCGCYMLDVGVFKIKLEKSERGEYEITDYVRELAKKADVHSVVAKGYWLPTTYAWKVLDSTEFLLNGRVVKGEGTRCNARIRGYAAIGDNCEIGSGIIENSVIMDNVRIGDNCVVKDSVIGDNTVINGNFTTISKCDGDVYSEIRGQMVDTGRKRLGVIIGDNAVIGGGVTAYPGVKIWPNAHVDGDVRGDVVK